MGRPPLNVVSTHVRLPAETLRKIDEVVGGKFGRAEFIREAVQLEIERREKLAVSESKASSKEAEQP